MSGGRPRYADQKSVVVDDFAKRLRPSLGDIAANPVEDMLHPPARQGISSDLCIPRIHLAKFELGEPSQKLLSLAQRERLHLLSNLLYAGRHDVIIALATITRQSRDSPPKYRGSANGGDQRLATLDFPSGPISSRVRCIALFCKSHHGPYDDIYAAREMQHGFSHKCNSMWRNKFGCLDVSGSFLQRPRHVVDVGPV